MPPGSRPTLQVPLVQVTPLVLANPSDEPPKSNINAVCQSPWNVPRKPMRARRAFTPESRCCGEVDDVLGLKLYPPTSKCRRLVNATQFRPSKEQIDGWL